jgi:DNA-binding NarL/FixJ family response regulator
VETARDPTGLVVERRDRTVIRVVVVDGQELVRAGLVFMLRSHDEIDVVGETGDGEEAVALATNTAPDVVLLDIRLPRLDGIEATRRILADRRCAHTRLIVLTAFDDDATVLRALRAGASGFLLKDTPPVKMLQAIHVVAAGEALIDPRVTRHVIERLADAPENPADEHAGGLTPREEDVLLSVARGLSNQEIAAHLHMGYGTVKTHVSHLLTKLQCRDRAQLVMYAYESGVVPRSGHRPSA